MRVVGTFDLGLRVVRLVATADGNSGSFDMRKAMPEIRVGIGQSWPHVVSVLLHEAVEFVAVELGCRYKPEPDYANGQDGLVFMMDHTQFSEAIARAGWFAAKALPELATIYRNRKKESK
jgi:hypothetical protein